MHRVRRRTLIGASAAVGVIATLAACASSAEPPARSTPLARNEHWRMPDEAELHERTWMCWPSSRSIWGSHLDAVQKDIVRVAHAILEHEPVSVLARPNEAKRLRTLLGQAADVHEAPVDDLWARDTLPAFLLADSAETPSPLAAGRLRFNGWGGKQEHRGDTRLAEQLASMLSIPLIDLGLTGEGGGIENDGQGTLLAARSSWVNENRNPGWSEADITRALCELMGAQRVLWVDGVAGQDITDGHIDSMARFATPSRLVIGSPAEPSADDVWTHAATELAALAVRERTLAGAPYDVVRLADPMDPRGSGDDFLSTYINYYVCNGAVIAPQFGDTTADDRAAGQLADAYPGRTVVQLDIDGIAAGGGGIHCATQQQPAPATS